MIKKKDLQTKMLIVSILNYIKQTRYSKMLVDEIFMNLLYVNMNAQIVFDKYDTLKFGLQYNLHWFGEQNSETPQQLKEMITINYIKSFKEFGRKVGVKQLELSVQLQELQQFHNDLLDVILNLINSSVNNFNASLKNKVISSNKYDWAKELITIKKTVEKSLSSYARDKWAIENNTLKLINKEYKQQMQQ